MGITGRGALLSRLFSGSKRESTFVRRSNVYVSHTDGEILVASMWNHGGLFAEMDGGVEPCPKDDAEALGVLLTRKLTECQFRKEFDYSGRKRSAWPAYQASGLKTLKAFEEQYVEYGVGGASAANVTWQIESPPFPNGVSLISARSAGTSPAELGKWVLEFHRFHLEVRSRVLGA